MSWLPLISLVVVVTGVVAENSYVMIHPQTIRSGVSIRMALQFLSPVGRETITAELTTYDNKTLSTTEYTIMPRIRKMGSTKYQSREERRERQRLQKLKKRLLKKDDVPPVAVPGGGSEDPMEVGNKPTMPRLPPPVPVETSPIFILPPIGPLPPDTSRTVLTNQQTSETSPVRDIILELLVPDDIKWGLYRIKVVGVGTLNFKNETVVNGNPRSTANFIQTDKANYKPGDEVQFRVFAIDMNMKLKAGALNIEIRNPKNIKIYELTGEDNHKAGGIQGRMPLSDMPPLGRYSISAEMVGIESSKENFYFEVKEYVLPRFEVTVTLPATAKTTDTSLTGTVQAKYTFGKPVLGPVVLTLSKLYNSGFFDVRAIQCELTLGSDGTVQFTIPIEKIELVSRNLRYETVRVLANVTEALTGITESGEATVRFQESSYKIEFFPNMPYNFKPGLGAYPVKLRVTEQDDRPPVLPTTDVAITTIYFTDKPVQGAQNIGPDGCIVISPFIMGDTIITVTKPYPLAMDGTVSFNLDVPENTATFSIKAEFEGVTVYKDVRRFRSPSNVFLKVTMGNTVDLSIGSPVTVSFTSSASPPPTAVRYVVQAKGNIVDTKTVPYSDGNFKIILSKAMAPAAKILVYFVRPDGEIVADGLNFVVDDAYENKVTVTFDQESSNTKTLVNLKVTADANSMVHVVAVDKSVLLLGDGNDITPGRVEDKMRQFGDVPWVVRGWGRLLPWPLDRADDASDIFDNSQLGVLTDANLYSFDLWRLGQLQNSGGGGGRMFASAPGSAGMMAAEDSGSDGSAGAPTGETRKDFPETWIWESAIATNGMAVFPATTPDTITTWAANAFAINAKTGLGVAPLRSNLTVFKPFFVSLQLPYSVTRGETVVIQANIFDYRAVGTGVTGDYAEVRLLESPQYEILSVDGSGVSTVISGSEQKCVQTIVGTAVSVFFNIRPLVVGDIDVNVRATLPPPINMYDEVIRKLPTKAEGIPKTKNQPVLISQVDPGTVTKELQIVYPLTGLVEGSEKIRVTLIGDLFGSTHENLEDLIKIPYGCGEQNMIKFAPSVFAARYLQTTNRWNSDPVSQEKIKKTLLTGYQRQLVYQRSDGSFSAFGDADEAGSVWLTAFVMKSFAQASQLGLITIDSNLMDRSVRFIVNQQTPDGDFTETGTVIHKALQGGSASTARALTAFVLIALKEVQKSEILKNTAKLTGAIEKASSYLVNNIGQMTTDYEMAISAFALHPLAQHSAILTKLEDSPNRVYDTKENIKYWKDKGSPSLSLETTAYALLTYSAKNDKINGFNILNWLAKQRNPHGGFYSTQDTVVALHALTEYAGLVYTDKVALTVTVGTKTGGIDGPTFTRQVNSNNHDVLQYIDFPGSVDNVIITATGIGLVVVEVNQFYNVRSEETEAQYVLSVTTSDETKTSYTVKVCASYNTVDGNSGMAIMDIGMLSGFEAQFDKITATGAFKRKEHSRPRIIIYFDKIGSTPVCATVPTQRHTFVANLKPASVQVYSYYEPTTERAMVEYQPPAVLLPPLCNMCADCCSDAITVPLINCGRYK